MKAIRIHETGDPDVLKYEDAPMPEPGAGQVRVNLLLNGGVTMAGRRQLSSRRRQGGAAHQGCAPGVGPYHEVV